MAAQPGVFAAGPPPSPEALRDAQTSLTHDPTLQFSFGKAPPPPDHGPTPPWLEAIYHWLASAFGWVGHILGWVFIGGLGLVLAIVLFFLIREFVRARWPDLFKKKPEPKQKPVDWRPDAAVARALLEEADRLAAQGRFAEAVRVILRRSIEEIDGRRPLLVRPALTSREISGLQELPEVARGTFASIAAVVERSLFGGRDVDAAGFAECRRTYEAFAFPGAWA
ncbi:MAG TPA: hypothetical protein VGI95_17055 [Caulobacteraceae bacterium]